jgi:hypothetical protein
MIQPPNEPSAPRRPKYPYIISHLSDFGRGSDGDRLCLLKTPPALLAAFRPRQLRGLYSCDLFLCGGGCFPELALEAESPLVRDPDQAGEAQLPGPGCPRARRGSPRPGRAGRVVQAAAGDGCSHRADRPVQNPPGPSDRGNDISPPTSGSSARASSPSRQTRNASDGSSRSRSKRNAIRVGP